MDDRGGPTGFRRFWTAATLSSFGTTLTAVALPVLVVEGLRADPLEVGLVGAAQFLPYAALGLLAGVYVDRWRRRTTLVVAGVGRAVSLAGIAAAWALDALSVGVLIVLLLAFGAFSVFGFAASQSLLPRLVPQSDLLRRNAQLDQGEAAAQTVGPTLAGLVVRGVGAPLALAFDALASLASAALVAGLRVEETPRTVRPRILPAIRDGLRATYRHPVLGPLSASTHVWFVANAASLTILSLLALRTLGLGAAVFGILLSVVGAATLLGASLAARVGQRHGQGRTIAAARLLYPVAWTGVAVVPTVGAAAGVALLFVALAVGGLAAGLENANEMSYRQQVTPDDLLGRVNATARSVNRSCAALGAVLGGLAAASWGIPAALWAVVIGFAAAAAIALLSPVKSARA